MRKSTAFEDQTIVQGMGNRIAKHVLNENFKVEKSTFYVLDASEERALLVKTEFRTGSSIKTKEMATYDKEIDYERGETFFKLKEHVVYGSSRVGIRTHDIDLLGLQNQGFSMRSVHYSIGSRQYELSNHLGNVLSVVSDKVIPYFYGGGIKEMRADIRVAQDYSPFGVTLSKRNFSVSEGYRYGFNGMEKDDEAKGAGNSYTTEFRQNDPRLGRWLSLDPVLHHEFSPYNAFDNNPISISDPSGSDGEDKNKRKSHEVKDGDNLWNIASNQLSSDASGSKIQEKINEILSYNPQVKGTGDKLKIGQVLFLEPEKVSSSKTKMKQEEKVKTVKEEPKFVFEAGKTYDLRIDATEIVNIGGASWGWWEASFGGHKAESDAGLSFGVGGEGGVFSRFTVRHVTFHKTITGSTLAEAMNKVYKINLASFGSVVHYTQMKGLTSNSELIWEASGDGGGLSGGFGGSASSVTFKNIEE